MYWVIHPALVGHCCRRCDDHAMIIASMISRLELGGDVIHTSDRTFAVWLQARRTHPMQSRRPKITERTAVLPTRDNAWLLRQNQVPPHHHATIPPLCGLMYMHVWSDVCGLTQRVLGSRRCNAKEHGHYGRQCIKNVNAHKVKAGRTKCGKKHSFTGL